MLAGLDGRLRRSPGRPARRAAAGPTYCRPGAISIRSTPARCRPRRPGSSAGNRRRCSLERYAQEHGNYPARLALSAWGTANMRTGGDDIAQALALIGVRPVWERVERPGHRLRDSARLGARPAAGRCHAAHFRLFPRRLSRADRPVRQRGARGRGARRAAGDATRSPPRVAADRRALEAAGAAARRGRRAAPAIASSARSRAPTAPGCRP